jgi:hypothetical protein
MPLQAKSLLTVDRMEVRKGCANLPSEHVTHDPSTGLLVTACVNRAPEGTFGCAIAEVGVHDLLKVSWHPVSF